VELSLISNDPEVATAAEAAGVDRLFVDLERRGKQKRQQGLGLFLSTHQPSDIAELSRTLVNSKLMVRIDAPHDGTRSQIDFAISAGADYIMLPYFHAVSQASDFVRYVGRRAKAVLLVETREAAQALPALAALPGVAEFHLGLNDLSISYGRRFLFELISDGTVANLCQVLRDANVSFGFGGIGSLSRTDLPVSPDLILAYQIALGASRGWLGRSFRDASVGRLPSEVSKLRERIAFWRNASFSQRQCMETLLMSQIDAAACQSCRSA